MKENKSKIRFLMQKIKVSYLWFEASPYIGMGYNMGLADGGHKTTAKQSNMVHQENKN